MKLHRAIACLLVVGVVLALGAGSVYANPPSPAKNPTRIGGGPSGIQWTPEACTQILQDGSFEGGSPNPDWEEFSTNFGTPLCENGFCGSLGQSARTGTWWAWFGGISSPEETGYLAQTLTIPSGVAELSFWMWSDTDTVDTDYLQVRIDSTPVFTVTGIQTVNYPTWTPITITLNSYADGAPHVVQFYSVTATTGEVTNFHVDDVALCQTVPTGVTLSGLTAAAAPRFPYELALLGGVFVLAAGAATLKRRR